MGLRSSRSGACLLLLAALALAPYRAAATAAATDEPSHAAHVDRGRDLYRIYCSNCHGPTAKGDGPTADLLLVKPKDLTQLQRLNDGQFPFERVLRTIDGREEVRGHGSRQMPIWGIALQEWDQDTNQQDEVAGRILLLTYYLKSLQQD